MMDQDTTTERRNTATQLTATQLKARGWTDTLIRDLLGAPNQTRINPHHRNGPPMRLYEVGRIEKVEGSAVWAARIEATQRRKEGAAQAVETKRARLQAHLDAVEINLPMIDADALTQLACDHYNQRQYDRRDFDGWDATPASDPAFLQRISVNFLRHAMSDYDAELVNIFGSVGVGEGYQEINRKAFAAIGAAYPILTAECQRQFGRKFGRKFGGDEGVQRALAE